MNENIVFIVGVGRSGTSLLQSMFAAHPDVNSLPEFSFLRRFIATGLLQSEFDRHGEKAVYDRLQGDKLLTRFDLDYSRVLPSNMDYRRNLDAKVYRNILSMCSSTEKHWIVEKDPRLVEYLPLVIAVFAQARVIHIVRDPRDVLVSKKSAKWSRSGHVWKHVFANRVQFALGRANGPLVFGSAYQEIIYEQLIRLPEAELQKVCKAMGLTYDSQMLSFGDAAKKLVSESEYSWKKETLGPLLNDNKQKWKLQLTPREIRLTERCCGEAMRTGNYAVDDRNHKLGVVDKLWLFVARLVIVSAAYPYIVYKNREVAKKCRKVA